jgi:hypothetical protein
LLQTGQTLASGGGWPHVQGEIKLWDLATTSERLAFADPHGVVYSLAFAPNGQTVATTGLGQSNAYARLGEGLLRHSCAG